MDFFRNVSPRYLVFNPPIFLDIIPSNDEIVLSSDIV